MKSHKRKKTIYYSDPLHDDFAGTKIVTESVDEHFPFAHKSIFWRVVAFFAYYFFAVPIVFLYTHIVMGLRIRGASALRKTKGGVFLYGNHTQMLDPFIPPMISFPRRAYTIANADAVSIRGIRQLVLMIGGLPLPTKLSGMRKFNEAVQTHIDRHSIISIYPEAHIWPYYTGVRPFEDKSFGYPVKMNRPVCAMATTYRKRLFLKRPRIVVHVSRPFYPDPEKSTAQNRAALRTAVYDFIREKCGNDNYEYIHYEYRPVCSEQKFDVKNHVENIKKDGKEENVSSL